MLRQQAERGGEEGRIFSSTKDPVICIATPFALFLNFYTSVLRLLETYNDRGGAAETNKVIRGISEVRIENGVLSNERIAPGASLFFFLLILKRETYPERLC
jgi:hypothetical protein